MAVNKIANTGSVVYNGETITSNAVETILLIAPTITKAVDKTTAKIGEKLKYTVVITNVALALITGVTFTDALPAGCQFVTGSFFVNGTAATPTVASNTITYAIPSIASLVATTILFEVLVTG